MFDLEGGGNVRGRRVYAVEKEGLKSAKSERSFR